MKFNFRLATLLKLRESTRDERRNHLALAYRAEAMVVDELQRVDGEMESLRRRVQAAVGPGEINVDAVINAQRFELVLKARKQHAIQQQELVKAEIERRRQSLVEADREMKTLEKLRRRHHERWLAEENLQDINRLDEAAGRRRIEEDR
jgi:flagellar export protein FliJ